MEIQKGVSFIANGPLRVSISEGEVSSRGLVFTPESGPLIVKAWETFDLKAEKRSSIRTAGAGELVESAGPYPLEWTSFLESLPDRGTETMMILGGSDTGKSTMSILAANRLLPSSTVGVVDGDVGQSDIGPPTTVGLGELGGLCIRLSEATLLDAYFAGDTSPAYCFQEVVAGTAKMVAAGRELGGSLVADTCGLVTGTLGQALASRVVEATKPDLLVLLEREDELGYLGSLGVEAIHLPALDTRRKNWEARRAFRLSQFLKSIGQTSHSTYELSSIRVEGYLARRGQQRAESILHAADLAVRDLFGMEGAVVGMHAGETYLGIGLLEAILPNQNSIRILTKSGAGANHIILGNLRLTEEGEGRILKSAQEDQASP